MKYIFSFLLVVIMQQSLNAQKNITGRVLTPHGSGMPGATILLHDKAKAVTSDDGAFTIGLPADGDTLTIAAIGYQKALFIYHSGMPVSIQLASSANALDTVTINTGYQLMNRQVSTGSYVQIDNEMLNRQVTTNIPDRLEGITNGLLVNHKNQEQTSGIMIRGLSTIQGPKEPLIVLDNFPYSGDLVDINPNDVEGITILKDAAAASIWGTQAGNGVIVITSKKGGYGQPVGIEFNTNVSTGNKPGLFKIPLASAAEEINAEQMLFDKGYFTDAENDPYRPVLSPVVETLIAKRDGAITGAQADAAINAMKAHDVRSDFEKYIYSPEVLQQYSLSFKGGTNKLNWRIAGGYNDNTTNVSGKLSRESLSWNSNFRPVKNLEISAGIYFTASDSKSGKPAYGQVTSANEHLYPYASFADNNGNPLPVIKDYRENYIDTAGGGHLLNWQYYPLQDYKYNATKVSAQDVLINTGIRYHLSNGLSLDVKYQYRRQVSDSRNLQAPDSYNTRNLINLFSQLDPSTGQVTYIVPKGSVLGLYNNSLQAYNLRGQINYTHTFSRFSLNAIGGAEVRQEHNAENGNTVYGYNDDVLTASNVDFVNEYPTYVTGYNSVIPNLINFGDRMNRFVSGFGNAVLAYYKKYMVSLSGRRDASNAFGVTTNNRWKPLWSAGGAWNISDETFYHFAAVPYMKFRATYGLAGNIDQSQAAVTTIRYDGTSPYTQTPYAEIENVNNPDLRWENVATLNLGIDFSTRGNRLSGSIEYYKKSASDLLGTAPFDYTAGLRRSVVIKNVASMRAGGWDIQLNAKNIDSRFKWQTGLNLSFYKDKVVSYYLPESPASFFINNGEIISGVQGKPVYSIFSYRWAGLDPRTGQPRGYINKDISEDYYSLTGTDTRINDLLYDGPVFPTTYGNIINTFSYKGFSLSVNLQFRFGDYFRRQSISYSGLYAYWQANSDLSLRWKHPGDELKTNVPAMVYPLAPGSDDFYSGSNVLVEKAANIRLQFINASYDLPVKNNGHRYIKQLQVYSTLSDIGIVWKATGYHVDPDYPYGSIPPALKISAGIRFKL